MSIKLDLSKFKHVKSDEHMTTLAHEKDGHTITLAHKSLSKPNQEQLAALAKMGKAEQDEPQRKGRDADVERRDRPDTGYGKIQYKANGGEIPDVDRPQAIELARYEGDSGESGITKGFNSVTKAIKDKNASNAAAQEEESEYAKGGKIPRYAEGDQVEVPDYLKPNSQVQQPQQMPAININVGGQPAQQVQPPMQQPGQLSDQDKASLSTLTQDKPSSLDGIPELNKNAPAPEQAVMSKEDKPVTGGLPGWTAGAMANSPVIDSRQPEQPAAPLDAQSPEAHTATAKPPSDQTPVQQLATTTKAPPQADPASQYVAEDQAWAQDLKNGHITPKTYQSMFNSKDTLGKIGTIFGMLLSGVGSGLTGKSNMLMDMMGKEIEQDLEAQKTSKTNALNFHNYVDSHAKTQAEIGHMALQNQEIRTNLKEQAMGRAAVQEMTNKALAIPDPIQRQKALQVVSMITQSLDNKSVHVADRIKANQAMYSEGGAGSGMDPVLMRINMAKSRYGEHVANDAMKELPEYEKKQKVMSGVHEAMDEMYKTAGSANIPLSQKARQYELAKTKIKTLTSEIFGGKSEAEFKLIDGMLPDRWADKKTFEKQKNSLMQKIDSQSAFPVLERIGAIDKKGYQPPPEIKTINGVKYMRGPDGKAVPVK